MAALAHLPWLNADRATAWSRVLAVVSLIVVAAWIALADGLRDVTGKPLGTDFVAFWTAARMLVDNAAATSVYDHARLGALQAQVFGADAGYAPFPYPPTFLLVCLPLGLLPYLPALAAWVLATGYAYWRVARAWLGHAAGLALPVLAFPAVLINLAHGQTAFLATALLGGGALLLGRRDFTAGLLMGALIFKPHLGLLIPVVLAASRNWRAFAGAAVSSSALVAASVLAFGPEVWLAFPGQVEMMQQVVAEGRLPLGKLVSVFASTRLYGAPFPAALAAHALVAVSAAVAVALFAWRHPKSPALGPALIAATLLVSPYMLDYDLLLAAPPLAWLLARGRLDGFRAWEKPVMLAAFVLPLVTRLLAVNLGLAVGPLVLVAFLVIVLRRGGSPVVSSSAPLRAA
jgi:alpha-1,2-mannosyltransferase